MIIVEPESCYTVRLRMPPPVPSAPAATQTTSQKPPPPVRHHYDDFWTEVVFEILKTNGDGPMLITCIVNQSLKWGKFVGKERTDQKKWMFKIVGKLIRSCRLDRYRRKFVTIPTSDARRQAFLAEAARPLNLPQPCV
jgi:hypothetical protein